MCQMLKDLDNNKDGRGVLAAADLWPHRLADGTSGRKILEQVWQYWGSFVMSSGERCSKVGPLRNGADNPGWIQKYQ